MHNKTVVVEGNIGAGKTTLLNMLKQYISLSVVPEPLSWWQKKTQGRSILDNFYDDPKRWSYTFQMYALMTHMVQQKQCQIKNKEQLQFVERSIFSYNHCFTKNCYEQNLLNDVEWRLYQESFASIAQDETLLPDIVIYLRTEPEVSYGRLQQRARAEESTVTLQYLMQLHQKYEKMFEKEAVVWQNKHIPVITICADREFEKNVVRKEQIVDEIIKACGLIALENSAYNKGIKIKTTDLFKQ